MLALLTLSTATWVLMGCLSLFLYVIFTDQKSSKSSKQGKAPGPTAIPILGNLLTIAKYADPALAFSALSKQYGDIVSVKLGSTDCLVISGMDKIKTILHTQGHLFDARPDFQRYSLIFGHNKDNSVAFSNWSDVQRKRRDLIRNHSFPRHYSSLYNKLDRICVSQVSSLLNKLDEGPSSQSVFLKPMLVETIAKVFLEYFASTKVTQDNVEEFTDMTQAFDEIFSEVNEGCIGDVIPALMFACNKSHLSQWGERIRKFVMKYCVEPRLATHPWTSQGLKPNRHSETSLHDSSKVKGLSSFSHSDGDLTSMDFNNNDENGNTCSKAQPDDMLQSFLNAVQKEEDKENGLNLDVALFAIEDIIGGHSAIANMLVRLMVMLASNPQVQEKVREEVEETVGNQEFVSLHNRMPYTEATVWEGVRHISSPIVPHVAVQDTSIDEYAVPKGTVLFINNWDLNFSTKHWKNPDAFMPERFLTEENTVLKPEYFIPFSTGRRSCLGYKMVQHVSFMFLSNFLRRFRIELDPTENYEMKPGRLAVPGDAFRFVLTRLD